ncbi:MAG: ribosome-associated translation inhibitor RaiA [Ruminococcaceae bacterium]|nr:ribosome-associated translation inhibitor RaiA [Oscillospiraceae bacterium]
MKITMIGRQMEVPADFKAIAEKKLQKFNKFFKDDAEAYVTLTRERNAERLELMISSGGTLYRSEEENTSFQNALDIAVDVIERQIRKNKTRLEKRLREGAFNAEPFDGDMNVEEEGDFKIRVKSFPCRPMSPEEAILQMNLIGHEFFMFRNAESGEVNVVYKRRDDNYGLLIPS